MIKKMLHPEETIVGVEPYLPEIIKTRLPSLL